MHSLPLSDEYFVCEGNVNYSFDVQLKGKLFKCKPLKGNRKSGICLLLLNQKWSVSMTWSTSPYMTNEQYAVYSTNVKYILYRGRKRKDFIFNLLEMHHFRVKYNGSLFKKYHCSTRSEQHLPTTYLLFIITLRPMFLGPSGILTVAYDSDS